MSDTDRDTEGDPFGNFLSPDRVDRFWESHPNLPHTRTKFDGFSNREPHTYDTERDIEVFKIGGPDLPFIIANSFSMGSVKLSDESGLAGGSLFHFFLKSTDPRYGVDLVFFTDFSHTKNRFCFFFFPFDLVFFSVF